VGVNSLPKTAAQQHRGCELNPGPSAPESQHANHSATEPATGPGSGPVATKNMHPLKDIPLSKSIKSGNAKLSELSKRQLFNNSPSHATHSVMKMFTSDY